MSFEVDTGKKSSCTRRRERKVIAESAYYTRYDGCIVKVDYKLLLLLLLCIVDEEEK